MAIDGLRRQGLSNSARQILDGRGSSSMLESLLRQNRELRQDWQVFTVSFRVLLYMRISEGLLYMRISEGLLYMRISEGLLYMRISDGLLYMYYKFT